ncbi:hypothetical protein NGA_0185300, partial [Nannochloropsis gaditana CCMP526]
MDDFLASKRIKNLLSSHGRALLASSESARPEPAPARNHESS